MVQKHTIHFTPIPPWTYEGKAPSHLTFFEAVKLAGLESETVAKGQAFRLDHATQKALLGFAPFGKQKLIVLDDGKVWVSRTVAFGRDFENRIYNTYDIKTAVEGKLLVSPGYVGAKYYYPAFN